MNNSFGNIFRLTTFGESHGKAIGGIIDGCPAGHKINLEHISNEMQRRKPGQSKIVTQRKEEDSVEFLSGIFEGKTTGTPIGFLIKNNDQKSKDYNHLKDSFRPSHADFVYEKKYGIRDYRGGGRSSARITAGWVAAGALVQDYLQKKQGVIISSYVSQIGSVLMEDISQKYTQAQVDSSPVRCPIEKTSEQMIQAVNQAKNSKDSLGGVITCVISGVKPGVGNPVFGKLNAHLAHAIMSINATKGFEIGGGFDMASKLGSEVNDSFVKEDDAVKTKSNFSGGIQGGISNGMDIVFRVAFKPTSTIGVEQITLDNSHDKVALEASGRHDPCVVPRAVPIVETMAALVLGDLII